MKKILGLMVVFSLLAVSVQATDNSSDNNTLHTFNSGETISSSKVNQNFVFASNYVVKSNGEIVGDFLAILSSGSGIIFLNNKGYFVRIDWFGKLRTHDFLFTDNTCTGDKYVISGNVIPKQVIYGWDQYSSEKLFVVDDLNTPISVYAYTRNSSGICQGNMNRELLKISLADPSVTGVNGDLTFPITIEKNK